MGAILKQRNLFVTKEFELTDESLKIKISQPFSFIEDVVKFENISSVISRKKAPNTILLVFSFAMLIGVIVTVFSHFFEAKGSEVADILVYTALLAVFLVLLRLTYENHVNLLLINGYKISFYGNSPDKQAVNDFIQLILKEQKTYLLYRYTATEAYLTEEQLSNNLTWLWERKIIDDIELHELRGKLLPNQHANTAIGFKFNTSSN